MAPIASARRPAPSRSQPVADPVGDKHRAWTQFLDQHRRQGSQPAGGFEALEERVLALSREVARAAIGRALQALDIAAEARFLGDLAAEHPGSRQAIDVFHATEPLPAAVAAACGEATREPRHRDEERKEKLREQLDGAAVVIRALGYRPKRVPHRTRRGKEGAYFRKNKGRMGYAALKAEGYPIGSGVVEAACKTMMTQRRKLAGMRWGSAGAQAILTRRGWDPPERFDEV